MITMDVIAVGVIVAAAFFFAIRRLYADLRGNTPSGCGCGCNCGCDRGCTATEREFCNNERELH